MNEKERLLRILKGKDVDRTPVICPGGMMSACTTEILEDIEGNHNLDYKTMARASRKIYTGTGFENYGVPFAMIAEAEPIGAKVQIGNKLVEERVIEYNSSSLEQIMKDYNVIPKNENRMNVVLNAIGELKNSSVPVIGNIMGHISTATSAVDPLVILKMLRKDPERVYSFFKFINNYLMEYAKESINAGADVIVISDPTATGEILGGKNFSKFAVPLYKEMIDSIHSLNVPVIVHICGNANTIIEGLNSINTDGYSFDSVVNMRHAKSLIKGRLMGNVSTQLLHTGEKDKIISITKNCIDSGVDIVSPACGLSMATSIDNLKTMTDYVKRGI
ncbi:uroporphyrinogen decarboxylase [Clostridium estertheticum]|uniref:uroporphyrinogen decarboxylase family protein n=1 Tax=Clostridium estertheticum TaxID=238834 RepID=UPI0013E9636A|nr:uroporphyrinogen decarboxylase family protein [Clostridium estertheticum]MBZ9686180.1 uroporphyrinogen decarboxylase [Clostridium estertheticum]